MAGEKPPESGQHHRENHALRSFSDRKSLPQNDLSGNYYEFFSLIHKGLGTFRIKRILIIRILPKRLGHLQAFDKAYLQNTVADIKRLHG